MKFKKLFIIIFIYTSTILGNIELKPWQDWWTNKFDVNLFNSYWGDSNEQSRKIIREIVDKLGYKSILDVGCGTATDFEAFKNEKIEIDYQGIDITAKLVEFCRTKGLNIVQADAENLPHKDNSFDIVYCRHLLEHLADYEEAINEFIRVAKSHVAIVFFIKPSKESDFIDLNSLPDGSLLFHNKYNKEKLEKFVLQNKKVKNISWQEVDNKEVILHIFLDFELLRQNDTDQIINFVQSFLPENPVIFEAGAYDGKDTCILKSFWPNCKIYAFEPVPYIYNQLEQNTKNLTNVYRYKFALSDNNGTAKFNLSEDPESPGIPTTSGSLLPAKEHLNHHFYTFDNVIDVQTITIDDWVKQNNINQIDFMWLDMQGYELPALKNAIEILKKVKVIYVEAEFIEAYKGQALYKELKSWIEEQGFKAIARDVLYPTYNQWCCNLVFIKNN